MPLLKSLRENLGLKVLALILAIGGWGYLRFSNTPIAARFEQSLTVPILPIGLPVDLVARPNVRDAAVTAVLPRGATSPVDPQGVRAVVDVSGLGEGVYSVPVKIVAPNLDVSSIFPQDVTVLIERVEERSIPISVSYVGEQRTVVADNVRVAPAELRVRGAASDLARVTAVRIEVPMPKKPASIDEMVRPIPTDVRGQEVPGVESSNSLVRVRANFSAARG